MADRARILPLTRWVRVGDVEAATGLSRRAAYEHLARAAGREAEAMERSLAIGAHGADR